MCPPNCLSFFFFNDTATTEIYTLSLHDALPISGTGPVSARLSGWPMDRLYRGEQGGHRHLGHSRRRRGGANRSEEHTSELQSHLNLVFRLLLEKKKKIRWIKSYVGWVVKYRSQR